MGCGLTKEYREQLRERIEKHNSDFILSAFDALTLLRQVDELEKEADWLAERASAKDCLMADTVENCTKKGFPCIACFRTAARKAVEEGEESCPKN